MDSGAGSSGYAPETYGQDQQQYAEHQFPPTSWDHEASTSGAGETPSQWFPSPGSTGHEPTEGALGEEAFSRFRNSMRAEARRSSSSARKSLLGQLGVEGLDPQGLPLQGQDESALSAPLPSQTSGPNADVHSAYERFGREEFSDHAYGIGRMIWRRITVDELIRYSRVSLQAPLMRRLVTTPVGHKAASVFAHLKAYMEDPESPGLTPPPPQQPTFMDKIREFKATALKKLGPVCGKILQRCTKLDRVIHFMPRTRIFHLQQLLLLGMKYGELRDEIFCQICKQTSYNPDSLSNERGWQVLAMCLGTFPPSERLKPALTEHLKQVIAGELGEMPGVHEPDKIKEISAYCLGRLDKILLVGPRHVPPTLDEIMAAERMEHTSVNVEIPGATPQVISLDSTVTGHEVTTEIASRLGLDDVSIYGIFVVVNGVERYAGSSGFVLESYAEWNIAPLPELQEDLYALRATRHLLIGQCASCLYNMDPDSVMGKDLKHGIASLEKHQELLKEDEEVAKLEDDNKGDLLEIRKLYADIHLIFKKNLFPLETADTEGFNRGRAFEYVQATHDVVKGLYVLEEADAVTLAALQLRAEHGSSDDLANFLTMEIIDRYGPKEYVTGFEKAWRNAILKKVGTLPWEVDVDVCRKDYLEFLHSRCPLYGSSWFTVVPKQMPQMPKEVFLLLNISGVYFVDIRMKEQLLYLRFIEICSWGYSDSSFSLVTGNMSYNMEFRLGTRNGREIAQTLQYFVNHTEL